MNPLERIQLVVLSYNRPDCLPALFDRLLLPAAANNVQITFIDNASDRKVKNYIMQHCNQKNFDFILNEENLGVAKGRNAGFKKTDREFSVYLDDDSLMDLKALEAVPPLFDKSPEIGILAFKVVHGTTGALQNPHGDKMCLVGNFHGAGHAIRRSVFETIGYLDETCIFGGEELEFSMRACGKNIQTIYTPEIVVYHYSMRRAGKALWQRRYYWSRNYSMVLYRYLPSDIAFLFSVRLLCSYVFSALKDIGIAASLLPVAVASGAYKGLTSRNPLGENGVAFYKNPETRPELGNVSLLKKIKGVF